MWSQRRILVCHFHMETLMAMPIYGNLDRHLPTTKLLQCNGCSNTRLRRHCLKQSQRGGRQRPNQNNKRRCLRQHCLRQDQREGQKKHNQNNVQKPSNVQLKLNGGAFIKLCNVNNSNNMVRLPAVQQVNKDTPNGNFKDLYKENNLEVTDLQKNLNNLLFQARAALNRWQLRSWMRMLKAMAVLSWSKMTILEVKTLDNNFAQCLFFHPLKVPWDRR